MNAAQTTVAVLRAFRALVQRGDHVSPSLIKSARVLNRQGWESMEVGFFWTCVLVDLIHQHGERLPDLPTG